MMLIVITDPKEYEKEAEAITTLFEEGLEVLHFRKPDLDIDKYEALLRTIPAKYYKRIVLHSHYKLIEKYNLKGIHLTAKYKAGVEGEDIVALFRLAAKRRLTISTSMHSVKEIEENKLKYDYIFLSPVFESISKQGYKDVLDKKEVVDFISAYKSFSKIIALGGINETNVHLIEEIGFSGAAILGAIWMSENPKNTFSIIKERLNA